MALLEKLKGTNDIKLPVHQFYSALIEWSEGATTRADIVSYFSLDASDETDLDWLKGKFDASANKREFADRIHGIFMLAESGYPNYQTQTELVAIISGIG